MSNSQVSNYQNTKLTHFVAQFLSCLGMQEIDSVRKQEKEMGWFYSESDLNRYDGLSGIFIPALRVPWNSVVRYQNCLWQVAGDSGSGGENVVLAGPNDEDHISAGGGVYGQVGDNRVSVTPETQLEHLDNRTMPEAERIVRMPYGTERGKAVIAFKRSLAIEAIVQSFPEFDPEEVERRYRVGKVVFDKRRLALAVAKYASIASVTLDPEKAGEAMGGLPASYCFVIWCQSTGKFIAEVHGAGEYCPACHYHYRIFRGANAWPVFRVPAEDGHTFVFGAELPFDNQKRATLSAPAE